LPYAVVVSNTDTSGRRTSRSSSAAVDLDMIQNATITALNLHVFTLPDRHIDYTG